MNGRRRALLTGATGFVGSHLARRLHLDGWAVNALVRPTTDPARLRAVAPHLVLHEVADDAGSVIEAVAAAAPQVCWHLATQFRGVHTAQDVDPLVEANIAFGARLAEGLAQAGVPLLVSTGTAWQHYDGATYSPTSLYAATKQAHEDLVRFYTDTGAFRAVHLKLFDTYGPGDPRGKLVSLLMERARTGEPLPMSPGEQLISLVHVDDVVAALLAAIELPAVPSQTYQVATSPPVSLRALVRALETEIDRPISVAWGARPYRAREMMTPWIAAPDLPGWEPKVQLADGLARLWREEFRDA
jgi:nucleoside-diphosphate-sugar epimerase